ncbi:MAG: membrane dipeptidase [Pseudomonadota bacterium]
MATYTFLGHRLARVASLALFFTASIANTSVLADAPEDAYLLHKRLKTFDARVDIRPSYGSRFEDAGRRIGHPVDLVKMRSGGLDFALFSAFTPQGALDENAYRLAREVSFSRVFAVQRVVQKYPEKVELIRRSDDFERLSNDQILGFMIAVENGYPIGTEIGWVGRYYDEGARVFAFTQFGHNQLATSSIAEERLGQTPAGPDEGLSALGVQVLAELNRLGMIADISHASDAAARNIIAGSKAPVIASHSAVRSLVNHPRNLSDDLIKAVAATGGVVHIVALEDYVIGEKKEKELARQVVKDRYDVRSQVDIAALPVETRAEFEAALNEIDNIYGRSTLEDYLKHIDYAVKLVGVDHVGIASNFGGGGGVVGWSNAEDSPNVTEGLLAHGYDAAAIEKLWAGNFIRVFRQVEQVARDLQLQAN